VVDQNEGKDVRGVYRWSRIPQDPLERWTSSDYSWNGLALKPWVGPTGLTTLQDYWRAHPTTGRLRTDTELRRAGELVATPSGAEYCIHHLTDEMLRTFPVARRQAIARRRPGQIQARLLAASRVDAIAFGKDFHINGTDTRAQLQGAWLTRGCFVGIREINAVFRGGFIHEASFEPRARFGPATDFREVYFCDPADFARCRFGMVSFDRACFYRGASFAEAWFMGITFFNDAWFEVEGDFAGARFKTVLDLYNAVFVNVGDFSRARCRNFGAGGAVFLNKSKFDGLRVKGAGDLASAYIAGSSSFQDASFGPYTKFSDLHVATPFKGEGNLRARHVGTPVSFSNARFGAHTSFEGAIFGGSVAFVFAVFQPSGSFQKAWFQGDADFTASALGRAMRFDQAVFESGAYFAAMEHASLGGGIAKEQNFAPSAGEFHAIDFRAAIFENLASFPGRKFQEEANFSGVIWRGPLNFAGASFRHDVNFENVRFASIDRSLWPGPFSLKRAWWALDWQARGLRKTGYESFIQFKIAHRARIADFSAPLEPRGVVGLLRRIGWFKPTLAESQPADWKAARQKIDAQYARQEGAFRALRAALGAAAVKVGENRLFELELTARYRRGDVHTISLAERALAKLYELTSRFGQSLARPLGAWCALIAISVLVYWSMGKGSFPAVAAHLPAPGRDSLDPDLWKALQASLSSAFKPFEVWGSGYERQFSPPLAADGAWLAQLTKTWPLISRLWSSTVSILSLTVLFLFGLAVKRRFQVT